MNDAPGSRIRHAGFLVLVVAAAAFIGLLQITRYASEKRFEKERAERRAEFVETVKKGDDGERIFIFDPPLIEMLAGDPDCVTNLRTLYLFCVDLDDRQVAAASKLTNVTTIYFYSCLGTETLLDAMQGMPSVAEIYFETTRLTDDGLRLLTTLPNLKKLELETIVPPEQEAAIKSALPNTEIVILSD